MHSENVSYRHLDVTLEGHLCHEPATAGRRPAVLVCHAWAGQTDFERKKAEWLARLGYVGFAIDMYGKGVVGTSREANSALMQPFVSDRALLRDRLLAALNVVQELDVVDRDRIAAIGFCFGGLCALDLARCGAPVRGAVALHGLLFPPALPDAPERIAAKVLAIQGDQDPLVPPEQVRAFAEEMTAAGADWQLHLYGHEVHAFTHREAEDPAAGNRYSERAERRALRATEAFLAEVFA